MRTEGLSNRPELPINPEADSEAFKFHQDRFKNTSEQLSNRGTLERMKDSLSGKDPYDPSPIDVAHEEALEDNAALEKRKNQEFKEWQRQLQPVIDHLRARRDDPEGEGKDRKIMVLVMGGGKKVTYSAGQLTALHHMGYKDSVDNIFGISGGGPVSAYFVAGEENGPKGTSLLAAEASDPAFFNARRVNQVMNIKHMGQAMRQGPKALDEQAVLDSKTGLYVAVNRADSSEMDWVDVKSAKPDMVSALEATGNIPFFKGGGIEVNEQEYFDGGFGKIDLQKMIEQFHPTDILILPNRPFDEIENLGPNFLKGAMIDKIPKAGMPGMVRKFLQMSQDLRKLMEEAKKTEGVNIGVLWPPETGLQNTTMDPVQIEKAIYESARDTFQAFGEDIQDVNLYKPEQEK